VLSLRVGNTMIAAIASLLYAVNPNTVFLSRLSVSESLIVFLSLVVMLCYVTYAESAKSRYLYYAAALAGMASLAKITGFYLVIVLCIFMLIRKKWRKCFLVWFIGLTIFSLYPIYASIYDYELFMRIINSHTRQFNVYVLWHVTRMFYSRGEFPLPFDPIFLISCVVFIRYSLKSLAFIAPRLTLKLDAAAPVVCNATEEKNRFRAEVIVIPVVVYAAVLVLTGAVGHFYPWYSIPFYCFIFLAMGVFIAELVNTYWARKSIFTGQ
jgi:4-amino-4-deoxy-L-arabinose transferase-like glycosyltransferase